MPGIPTVVAPLAIAIDSAGNVWVANAYQSRTSTVTELSPSGTPIRTITVGVEPESITFDLSENMWIGNHGDGTLMEFSPTGDFIASYSVPDISGNGAVDANGNLWFPQHGNGSVVEVSTAGAILQTIYLGAGSGPYAVAIDAAGNIWVAATANSFISELSPSGSVIGTYTVPAGPFALAIDSIGNVWVASTGSSGSLNNTVIELSSTGSLLKTCTTGNGPQGLAIDSAGDIWVTNRGLYPNNNGNTITELSSNCVNLGTFTVGNLPVGIAIDNSGSVWVANLNDNTVTKLSSGHPGVMTPINAPIQSLGQWIRQSLFSKWPTVAGIPFWTGGAAWAGAYNGSNQIPASYVNLSNYAPLASPTFTGTVGGITAAMIGLGNVTNDAQTKAAVVPNTVPAAGQDLVGNAGGTAYAPVTMSGDCTRSSTGAIICTKTNGTAFGTGATATISNYLLLSQVPSIATMSSLQVAAGGTFGTAAFTASSAYDAAGAAAARAGTGTCTAGQYETGDSTSGPSCAAPTASQVGLGSVTNDAQTKAAVVPNTVPAAGQDLVGNAGGTAYAPVTMSGDCTRSSTGAITCTKTNGTSFGTGATATIANYETTAAAALLAPLASPTFTGTVSGITATMVGLGNVTNNAQTQAAIVPNTAPSSGQDLVGNAGGTAYAPVTMSGDCTRSSTGAITCTKSNGSAFAAGAFAAASTTLPSMDGTTSYGSGTTWARADHIHPSDTSRVSTSTTVNGHALSSNVTVSASDLTTGTLPHAQLPTLLSGDIPNNAANTTGNAATATKLASNTLGCLDGWDHLPCTVYIMSPTSESSPTNSWATAFTTSATGVYRVTGNVYPTASGSAAYNVYLAVNVLQTGGVTAVGQYIATAQMGDGADGYTQVSFIFNLSSGTAIPWETTGGGTLTGNAWTISMVIERLN